MTSTNKPLDDIEPRTVIRQADIPLLIDEPGSYVLAENIRPLAGNPVGITIDSDHVTLDLGGFALTQNDDLLIAFSQGVQVTGTSQNVTIRNGIVRGSFFHGIDCLAGSRVRIEDIHASNNGGDGIAVDDDSVVIDCTSSNNTG